MVFEETKISLIFSSLIIKNYFLLIVNFNTSTFTFTLVKKFKKKKSVC